MRYAVAIAFVAALLGSTGVGVARQMHFSKGVGQENREIKSLSPEDIAELRRGGGWGFARAAELNGVPGPTHLLNMKREISLSQDQVAAITAIRDDMRSKAIAQGKKLIALERRLGRRFSGGTITDDILRSLLAQIAATRRALRYIHLSTHLKTPDILTPAQTKKYNALRGNSPG